MPVLSDLSSDLAAIVDAAGRSVVRVDARRRIPASGIIWSADGTIVTANHVVQREENITVGLPDGSKVGATLAGRDPATDVAVLRLQSAGLTAAPRASTEGLRVGHLVLALGRPGRTVRAPLGVGRVLGLNTAALVRGFSLTIPTVTLQRVVETLLAHGRVRRGYLGIGAQPVRLAGELERTLGQRVGLLLVSIEPGSPADQGGLFVGDILVGFDGQPVAELGDLMALLGAERIGKPVPVRIVRGGQVRDLTVGVGER